MIWSRKRAWSITNNPGYNKIFQCSCRSAAAFFLQVLFFDDMHMMCGMACRQEAHGQYISRLSVGRAGGSQLLVGKGSEEQFGGFALRFEFFEEIAPFAFGSVGISRPGVLVKARERGLILSCKAERPVTEYPLCVDDMLED